MRSWLKASVALDILCILAALASFLGGAVAARFGPPVEEDMIGGPAFLFLLLGLILIVITLPCLLMLTLGAVFAVRNREQVNERVLDI
jgi:heme/copper-type cytochrome/quinol oxidase subunit 2